MNVGVVLPVNRLNASFDELAVVVIDNDNRYERCVNVRRLTRKSRPYRVHPTPNRKIGLVSFGGNYH